MSHGGTSDVYLAQDASTGRSAAIKVLVGTLADDPRWTARYQREAAILARIRLIPT